MQFEWEAKKSRENLLKHDVRFETAVLVFDDPYALTQRDLTHDEKEDRFITLGAIGPGSVLFVVHTWRGDDGREKLRIISARAATARERTLYEEAHKRAKAGHHGGRRKKGSKY